MKCRSKQKTDPVLAGVNEAKYANTIIEDRGKCVFLIKLQSWGIILCGSDMFSYLPLLNSVM